MLAAWTNEPIFVHGMKIELRATLFATRLEALFFADRSFFPTHANTSSASV
jgi:hypothetical protein